MSAKSSGSELFNEMSKWLNTLQDPHKLKQLSLIEMDILKEKLRQVYDRISLIPEDLSPKEPPIEFEIEIAKENVISAAVIEEQIHESETEHTEIASEELLSEEVEKVKSKEPRVREKEHPDLFSPAKEEQVTASKTVVDAIAGETQKESIADKLQKHSKVESLKKAIGINEKFFFINELFDGNLTEYNAAIESLDHAKTIEESHQFIDGLSQRYKWQGNAEAVEQLKQFVERKLK